MNVEGHERGQEVKIPATAAASRRANEKPKP